MALSLDLGTGSVLVSVGTSAADMGIEELDLSAPYMELDLGAADTSLGTRPAMQVKPARPARPCKVKKLKKQKRGSFAARRGKEWQKHNRFRKDNGLVHHDGSWMQSILAMTSHVGFG